MTEDSWESVHKLFQSMVDRVDVYDDPLSSSWEELPPSEQSLVEAHEVQPPSHIVEEKVREREDVMEDLKVVEGSDREEAYAREAVVAPWDPLQVHMLIMRHGKASTPITDVDRDQAEALLNGLELHLSTPLAQSTSDQFRFFKRLFSFSSESTLVDLEKGAKKWQNDIYYIYFLMNNLQMLDRGSPYCFRVMEKVNKCRQIIDTGKNFLSYTAMLNDLGDPVRHLDLDGKTALLTFVPLSSDCKARQRAILACLKEAARLGLKKKGTQLYHEKKTSGHIISRMTQLKELEALPPTLETKKKIEEIKGILNKKIDEVNRKINELKEAKQTPSTEKALFKLKIKLKELCRFDHSDLNGIGTCFYQPWKSIQEFVCQVCNKDTRFDLWQIATTGGNRKEIENYLTMTTMDIELPELEDDRKVTSWRNGIYFLDCPSTDPKAKKAGQFIEYGRGPMPKSVVSSQYFDCDFPVDENDTFPVPTIEQLKKRVTLATTILTCQGYSLIEIIWFFGMVIGRPLHGFGLDRFEQIPYLFGVPGTGKSSFLNCLLKCFMPHHVASLDSNMEAVFGLAGMFDKRVVIGADIKENFNFDPATLQKMASCDLIKVSLKQKTSISIRWNVMCVLGGNTFPTLWKADLGALERRMCVFDFPNVIKRKDPTLPADIMANFGEFYRFANECYLYLVNEYADKVFDEHLPPRFLANRRFISEIHNPLVQFLNDATEVEVGEYVREEEFLKRFRYYCEKRQLGKHALQHHMLEDLLKQRSIKIVEETREWPINSTMTSLSRFYVGLQLVSQTDDIDVE